MESAPPQPLQEWIDRSRQERIESLSSGPEELAAILSSADAEQLSKRPSADDWSPVEVLCHLRDVEELSLLRFRMMIQMDEPLVPAAAPPADKERWGLLEEGAALFDQERLAEQPSTRAMIPSSRWPHSPTIGRGRSGFWPQSPTRSGSGERSIPRMDVSTSTTSPRSSPGTTRTTPPS